MNLNIRSVRFKRSVNSPLEAGVAIEPSAVKKLVLLYLFGSEVNDVWYFVEDGEFSVTWKPGEFKERAAK